MAITAAKTLSGFSDFINPEMAGPIFEDAARKSVVMQAVPQIPLSYSGVSIPVVTERPKAAWVTEGAEKGKTQGGMKLVTMEPKKLAAIAVVSQEVVRANPGNYVTWLRPALADAFALAFDFAAIHGIGGDGTGTGPFTADLADTTKTRAFGTGTTLHNDLTYAGKLLAAEGRKMSAIIMDDSMEWDFLDALDGVNRPLYVAPLYDGAGVITQSGRLLNRPCYVGDAVGVGTTVGFAGDFSKARWGVVGGINFSVSTETSVTINGTLTSLWEHNLVAIRAEAEYGFVMSEAANFVKFTKPADVATLGTPGFATP